MYEESSLKTSHNYGNYFQLIDSLKHMALQALERKNAHQNQQEHDNVK